MSEEKTQQAKTETQPKFPSEIIDLPSASDNLNISALAKPVEKYFLCYPNI